MLLLLMTLLDMPVVEMLPSIPTALITNFFKVHVPWTKTTFFLGADILVSEQQRGACPVESMRHHTIINRAVPNNAPLFAYATQDGWAPLTRSAFLARCNELWAAAGLCTLTGHSFRIGGATAMLLRGIPPEIVAVQGRWKSSAFLKYWRQIDAILPLWTAASDVEVDVKAIRQTMDRWARTQRLN